MARKIKLSDKFILQEENKRIVKKYRFYHKSMIFLLFVILFYKKNKKWRKTVIESIKIKSMQLEVAKKL